MKIIIRSLVVALAITGAIATTSANGSSVKTTIKANRTSAAPQPDCYPDDNGYKDCDW